MTDEFQGAPPETDLRELSDEQVIQEYERALLYKANMTGWSVVRLQEHIGKTDQWRDETLRRMARPDATSSPIGMGSRITWNGHQGTVHGIVNTHQEQRILIVFDNHRMKGYGPQDRMWVNPKECQPTVAAVLEEQT